VFPAGGRFEEWTPEGFMPVGKGGCFLGYVTLWYRRSVSQCVCDFRYGHKRVGKVGYEVDEGLRRYFLLLKGLEGFGVPEHP